MALPEKIKVSFKKIGSKYSIVSATGIVENDNWYCEPILNTQATKPFVLLNFLKVNFPFDTPVTPGTVVAFDVGSFNYIVTVMLPELFKNSVNQYLAVLYRCNDVASILRQTKTRDPETLKIISTWVQFGQDWPVLLADPYLGSELSENSNRDLQGMFSDNKQNLYISGSSGIILGDRISLSVSGGYQMVSKIKRTRYDNVFEVELDDDNRQ